MCLKKYSNNDLIKELHERGFMTNSFSNDLILSGNFETFKVILTHGEPKTEMKCRQCRLKKPSDQFRFYQARVDSNGYLMRSNALCNECSKKSNSERKKVLDSAIIPKKPKSGDICVNCNREWTGNWHRHHEEDRFVAYICGHCNMSFSDQRNKHNLIKLPDGGK